MAELEWITTIEESKVGEGSYVAVYPRGLSLLLVKVDGELHAIDNKCVHMGCPLEGGKLTGHILTCPCHDWRFDVRTGDFVTASELSIRTYDTRVEDGRVLVELGGHGHATR